MTEREQPAPRFVPDLTVVALAAAIGVPAALLAAAFLAVIHVLEHWLWPLW